jgi:hypothetical protein
MLDKGIASFLVSMGFDGGAAGRGAGGTSSWLRLLNKLIKAALPCYEIPYVTVLLVYRGILKKGKPFLGYLPYFSIKFR